jgi:hypothetical protein
LGSTEALIYVAMKMKAKKRNSLKQIAPNFKNRSLKYRSMKINTENPKSKPN